MKYRLVASNVLLQIKSDYRKVNACENSLKGSTLDELFYGEHTYYLSLVLQALGVQPGAAFTLAFAQKGAIQNILRSLHQGRELHYLRIERRVKIFNTAKFSNTLGPGFNSCISIALTFFFAEKHVADRRLESEVLLE